MLSFVSKYGFNVHSQNGEDGIIAQCLKRLGLSQGFCVEIGGNDGLWLSNTRLLIEHGWGGKFIESEWGLYLQAQKNWAHRKDVICICSKVDGHNVNAFVNDDCDLLSIDTDGNDYEIFKGLKARPKMVIVEIDSSIPPDLDAFNSQGGSGYKPMIELGLEKGYSLLCHTGNVVFIDQQFKSIFPEIKSRHPIIDAEYYFNRGWLKEDAA